MQIIIRLWQALAVANHLPLGQAWGSIERLQNSATVLKEVMAAPDKGIPEEVLDSVKCVVIVPHLIKGGFIVCGKHGRGVATCSAQSGADNTRPIVCVPAVGSGAGDISRLQMSAVRPYGWHTPARLSMPELWAVQLARAPQNGLVRERNHSGAVQLFPRALPLRRYFALLDLLRRGVSREDALPGRRTPG